MINDSKRPLKVFLCHAHADRDAVRGLYARLKREGVDMWLDKEKLLPGADWEYEIRKAVREADVVVVCLSKQFNQAGFRQKEVRIALDTAMEKPEGEIFIIPARLEECDSLESLGKWHWVDLFESDGFQRLILALRVRADKIGAALRQRRGGHATISRPKINSEQELAEKAVREKAEQESAAKALLESEELERQKAAREKSEQEALEKARLEAEELERQKTAKAQADREAEEKAAREKKEREAIAKARLNAEELERQKAAKVQADREAAEKAAREKMERDTAEKARLNAEELARQKAAKEKAEREAADKAAQAKIEKEFQREVEKRIKKAKRELQWERFKSKIRFQLDIARIYALPNTLFLIGIAFAIYMFIYYSKNIPILNQLLHPAPQPSQISTEIFAPSKTFTPPQPTLTFTPVLLAKTETPTFASTATSLQDEIVDDKGITMRLIPAGTFTMGSEDIDEAKPVHEVYLDDFYIDKYEVTNALYKACVDVGGCTPPQQTKSYTRSSYYGNLEFDDYPVIYVDWNQAETYCKWRNASLPTGAQWEKAARGTDGRTYPWGEDINCNKANYNSSCVGDTSKVGSYESGKSPYGIYDLAGNIWEWTADWYSSTYYENSPSENPLGPDIGQYRVVRGGSWGFNDYFVRSAARNYGTPDDFDYYSGFRCARSLP